jgi:hypothetical protein
MADGDRYRVHDSRDELDSTNRMADRGYRLEVDVALRRGDRHCSRPRNPSEFSNRKRKLAETDRSPSVKSKHTRGVRGEDRRYSPSPERRGRTSDLTNGALTSEVQGRKTREYAANHVNLAASRLMCFRISGVPLDWSEDDLLGALKAIDPYLRDEMAQLSLYPACSGPTQTALLNLGTYTQYFRALKPNESTYESTSAVGKTKVALALDSHFYDLTPLNTPGDRIVAEFVIFYISYQDLVLISDWLQCSCGDWPCRPCIWVVEEPRNTSYVAERLSATRLQEHPDYVLWI